jgi:hypothetical protein
MVKADVNWKLITFGNLLIHFELITSDYPFTTIIGWKSLVVDKQVPGHRVLLLPVIML